MNRENYMKGTKDNYTHIKFTYGSGMTMIVNKSTYKHVYPREKQIASKFEYLIEKQE